MCFFILVRMQGMYSRYESIAPPGALSWLAEPLPKSFRVNALKAAPAGALSLLAEEGIHCVPAPWHPDAFVIDSTLERHALGNTLAHFLGQIYVQDLASLLPVMALEPHLKPLADSTSAAPVLDACAAPGSKTSQLAAALENRGAIAANDPSWQRVKALKSNLERLGVANTLITNLDLRRFPRYEFQAILLDAPCSSEGTVRKSIMNTRPQQHPEPARLAALQKQLLARAFALLAPGGALVYSTCTLAPEENELVVASLLEAQPGAHLEPVKIEGAPLAPGVTEWQGQELPELEKARRLWPGPHWGGFFLAMLRKEG